jgi:hypothetical protein
VNGGCHITGTIFDTLGGRGIQIIAASGTNGSIIAIKNCDFYNITGDAINHNAAQLFMTIRNCNFTKCGRAINCANFTASGAAANNGYGAGTEANTSADVLKSLVETGKVTYGSNLSPYNAPATGDFRIVLAAAKNAGIGVFTETDGTNTGTVGYPDIGAAQHLDSGGGAATSYGFAA